MSAIRSLFRELKDAGLKGFASLDQKLAQLTDKLAEQFDTVIREFRDLDAVDSKPDMPSTSARPYNPIRGEDGNYVPGSLPSKDELRDLTRTEPGMAFYWSGRDASGAGVGPDDSGIAEKIASSEGGQTLEQTLAANGIDPLPKWNRKDPESVRFWEDASAAFAENASGDVRAVVGCDLREGNIWETIEIPRLLTNPKVPSISQVDPDTGIWTTL